MKKGKMIIIILVLMFGFVLVGDVLVNVFHSNNRTNYKVYEENGSYYYRNYFSNKRTGLNFSDGLALIHEDKRSFGKIYEGLSIWKYIDETGNVVLTPDVYIADAFSEGLAAVMPFEGSYWGYIDKNGEMVIEPQFRRASMFKNGIASVYIENDSKWILINKSGDHIQDLDEAMSWESQTQADPKND